jgi:hypothetical protein
MNERIRLLAEQAFFDDASGQPSDRVYTFSDHKMQKFAELIVRECIEHLEGNVAVPNLEHSRTKTKCIRSIKEHFGVES